MRLIDVDAVDDETVEAIPIEWLDSIARKAEHDVYYCKGDACRNADIMRAVRVIKDLWAKEVRA